MYIVPPVKATENVMDYPGVQGRYVKFYASGAQFVSGDGATYTIPVAAWRDGQQVYCVITDANGISVQTNTVTVTIGYDINTELFPDMEQHL